MSPVFKSVVVFTVAAILCAATFFLVPFLRCRENRTGEIELVNGEPEQKDGARMSASGMADEPSAVFSHPAKPTRSAHDSFEDRENTQFDVGEMRNEVEDLLTRFRGTPEERQEVIDECAEGREFILLMAELSESSIEEMSPEELEKERENFEKEYRAQLDCLQTGFLQQMLETSEEEEVIGGALEAAQDFLERIDAALLSAGY